MALEFATSKGARRFCAVESLDANERHTEMILAASIEIFEAQLVFYSDDEAPVWRQKFRHARQVMMDRVSLSREHRGIFEDTNEKHPVKSFFRPEQHEIVRDDFHIGQVAA